MPIAQRAERRRAQLAGCDELGIESGSPAPDAGPSGTFPGGRVPHALAGRGPVLRTGPAGRPGRGARTRPGLQGDVFRFTLGLVYSIFD